MKTFDLDFDGDVKSVTADPDTPLLYVLRSNRLRFTFHPAWLSSAVTRR